MFPWISKLGSRNCPTWPKLSGNIYIYIFIVKYINIYIYSYIYLRREMTKASLWLRGCPQRRPGQRLAAQEEVMGQHRAKINFMGRGDIAATLIGGIESYSGPSASNACPLQSLLSSALNNPPIHVNSHHIGSALFSPVLSQALNRWPHAPHVGRPFQSSN